MEQGVLKTVKDAGKSPGHWPVVTLMERDNKNSGLAMRNYSRT